MAEITSGGSGAGANSVDNDGDNKLASACADTTGGEASGSRLPTSPSTHDLNLSTLEKIKRFFFSKEEWEAYLLEKLDEEKRRQGRDAGGQRAER